MERLDDELIVGVLEALVETVEDLVEDTVFV